MLLYCIVCAVPALSEKFAIETNVFLYFLSIAKRRDDDHDYIIIL